MGSLKRGWNTEPWNLHAVQRRSDSCIPRNETVSPRSQFLRSCICERFTYPQDRFAYFAAANKGTDLFPILSTVSLQCVARSAQKVLVTMQPVR